MLLHAYLGSFYDLDSDLDQGLRILKWIGLADTLIKLNKGIGPGRYNDKFKEGHWPRQIQ